MTKGRRGRPGQDSGKAVLLNLDLDLARLCNLDLDLDLDAENQSCSCLKVMTYFYFIVEVLFHNFPNESYIIKVDILELR